MDDYIISIKGIKKSFPGVKALDGINLNLRKNSVHAIVGENGAGKSTLMKCLLGLYTPDEGEIYFDSKIVSFKDASDALNLGISMIHQELSPVVTRNVMENIWMGRYPLNKFGFVEHKKMQQQTQDLFDDLGIDISHIEIMSNLSVAKMQMIEIAKAISYKSKVIIMDEPSSALSQRETEQLFSMIKKLKEKNVSILYISHRLAEIFTICDEATVLRDGKWIITKPVKEFTTASLVTYMVGRDLTDMFPKTHKEIGSTKLVVENLTCQKVFKAISFELRKGEILGFAGLIGAGRTELMEALFGLRKFDSGTVKIDGKEVSIKNPYDAIKNGFCLVTEDRRHNGIIPMLSVKENMVVVNLSKYLTKIGLLKTKPIDDDVRLYIEKLRIKSPTLYTLIQNLSGGNQQKTLIARWLLTEPEILILDEPTRGIDVGAKAEIYSIISDLASNGKSIIVVSSEMPEIIGLCDRTIVMHEGMKTGELDKEQLEQEKIMDLAMMDVAAP